MICNSGSSTSQPDSDSFRWENGTFLTPGPYREVWAPKSFSFCLEFHKISWILEKFPPVSDHGNHPGSNSQGSKHHNIFLILLISSWDKTHVLQMLTGIDNLLHSHPQAVFSTLTASSFGKYGVLVRRIVVGWMVARKMICPCPSLQKLQMWPCLDKGSL